MEQKALEEIRKVYGTSAVFRANEDYRADIPAITTGSFNLDDAIGVGGIPEGRLVLWSGPESSGKTLLSLCLARRVQSEAKGSVLYIDAEYTFNKKWTEGLGIDLSKFYVAPTGSAVAAFELLNGKPKNKKRQNAIPGILTNEEWKKLNLKLVIIDSINALQPPLEEDAETGDILMAPMSRFLPPVLRRMTPILAETGITCIGILQSRTNIGQLYGDPLTVSGGKALMHAASVWVDFRKIGGSEITVGDKKKEPPIGHKIRAKVRKNKVSPPDRSAEITIFYDKGIDIRSELADQGVERGVIENSGNTYKYAALPNGKVIGKNKLEESILENKKIAKILLEDIKAHRVNSEKERKKDLKIDFVDEQSEPVNENITVDNKEDIDDIDLEKSVPADPDKIVSEKVPETQKAEKIEEKKVEEQLDLENMSKSELTTLAKKKKISNYYKMSKKQLVKKLHEE